MAIGALVALTMVGAFATAGVGGAKAPDPTGTTAILDSSIIDNRLWIEDITPSGEYIEIESWSWGVTQPSGSTGGGGSTGKATFQDMHFTTHLSKFSPKVAKDVASGLHIKKVIFEDFSAASKKGNETLYLKITLSDCLITSYQIGGSSGGSDMPTESISINFAKIEFSYNPKNDDRLDGSSSFTYDLKEGKFE